MKIILKLIVVIFILSNFSCSYNRTLLRKNNKYVRNQHEYLNKESKLFLSQATQNDFEKNLRDYLRDYKNYNFFNGSEVPSILTPLIIDNHNKAIAFVAVRKNDNSGKDVVYVKFISAKFENNTWTFGVKDLHTYSILYIDNIYPRLNNYEITEQTIQNLMLEGFFRNNPSDKSIFKSTWYVF